MKYLAKAAAAFLLFAGMAGGALADSNPPGYYDKESMCMTQGHIFTAIANQRDNGESPQYALKLVMQVIQPRSGGRFSIDESQVKKAINIVYFDPAFSFHRIGSQLAPGSALSGVVFDMCLHDWKAQTAFQPLK